MSKQDQFRDDKNLENRGQGKTCIIFQICAFATDCHLRWAKTAMSVYDLNHSSIFSIETKPLK